MFAIANISVFLRGGKKKGVSFHFFASLSINSEEIFAPANISEKSPLFASSFKNRRFIILMFYYSSG